MFEPIGAVGGVFFVVRIASSCALWFWLLPCFSPRFGLDRLWSLGVFPLSRSQARIAMVTENGATHPAPVSAHLVRFVLGWLSVVQAAPFWMARGCDQGSCSTSGAAEVRCFGAPFFGAPRETERKGGQIWIWVWVKIRPLGDRRF